MKYYNINNFVIVKNLKNHININGYDRIFIGSNIILYYEKSNKFSFYSLLLNDNRIELQWNNSYYPIFKYSAKNYSIITTDYKHYFDLKLELTINQNNVIEFILFNTTTKTRTLHNKVERIFHINKIIIDENQIKFDYVDERLNDESLINVFQKQIYNVVLESLSLNHGIFLSGGSESRINAAIAQYYGLQKEFITWGHPEDKEYRIAGKIANKLKTKHINIRPDVSNLPYKELLLKTGFLVNMQYAYRYSVVKQLFENYDYDLIWTGWGDINGYPTMYQPSELFSDFYLGLYKGEKRFPNGWDIDWLHSYKFKDNPIFKKINIDKSIKTFFILRKNFFAPYIFGQVLSIENILGSVYSPWFNSIIYKAIYREENIQPRIIYNKKERTIWKNDLYYHLIKQYYPPLNKIINSKGYYPWMVRKQTGCFGLGGAYLLKKLGKYRKYPFDPVEDRNFLKLELQKILDDSIKIFNKEDILEIIKNIDLWNGYQILEIFKLIQIYWFLKIS